MRTAVDSSALLAVFNGEAEAERWLEILIAARRAGQLVVCPVVYAELAPSTPFSTRADLDVQLARLGILFDPLLPESAFLAGRLFRDYRAAGGPREHLIPDFLIAAHAQVQADQLAALDRGYYRRYFSRLHILRP